MKTVEESIESIEFALLQIANKIESQGGVLTQQDIDLIDKVYHILYETPDDAFPF